MTRAALLALAAAALCGCRSQWYMEEARTEIVRTDLVIRTDPPGAMVSLNGRRMEASPVRIPVEYEHTTELWARQGNAGARMREESSGLGAILAYPASIPASVVHGREETRRHVYGANRHVVSARMDGHAETSQEIVLEGEAEVEVVLALPATGR